MARLFLLFTVVPLVELYLLIAVGRVLGPVMTIALVLFTGEYDEGNAESRPALAADGTMWN